MSDSESHWLRRLEATGKAQSRYLWLVLIVGLFYAALRTTSTEPGAAIRVPVVDLPLNAATVLASGSAVMAFLVLAVMGAIRAWTHALESIRGHPATDAEELDTYPNALDLAVYTTSKSPMAVRSILGLVYPSFLSLALAESLWLGCWLRSASHVQGRLGFLIAAVITWVPAAILVVMFWYRRIRQTVTGSAA